MKKVFSFYFFLHVFIIFMIFFIFSPEYDLAHFINLVFIISFLYLLVTLFLYTKRGGFYDGITYGFRRFKRITMKEDRDYVEDWKNAPLPSEKVNGKFFQFIKYQTIALLILFFLLFLLYSF